jgi:hypothetical protein
MSGTMRAHGLGELMATVASVGFVGVMRLVGGVVQSTDRKFAAHFGARPQMLSSGGVP